MDRYSPISCLDQTPDAAGCPPQNREGGGRWEDPRDEDKRRGTSEARGEGEDGRSREGAGSGRRGQAARALGARRGRGVGLVGPPLAARGASPAGRGRQGGARKP